MSASSSSRTDGAEALCRHFGSCGGCAIQNLPYPDQLKFKAEKLARLMSRLGAPEPVVHPSPQTRFYRNKMEFSFGKAGDGGRLHLGLKVRKSFSRVLDLEECLLSSPETPRLLGAVREWAARRGLKPYDARDHSGLLRHVIVREAKSSAESGERMVGLIAAPGDIDPGAFAEAVTAAYPASSVWIGWNAKPSDTAVADAILPVQGSPSIVETLFVAGRELSFKLSPYSFFQTNTKAAEVLYGQIVEWAGLSGAESVLDVYSGSGGIALSMAGSIAKVSALEMNPQAVADATENAARNGVGNVRFYDGTSELLLAALLDTAPDLVVVDPPRAGLMPRALKALLASPPPRLLYVSCNPGTLARDVAALVPFFRPERLALVDMFPHTEHLESALLLSRVSAPKSSVKP